jgi:hypothetical protein
MKTWDYEAITKAAKRRIIQTMGKSRETDQPYDQALLRTVVWRSR